MKRFTKTLILLSLVTLLGGCTKDMVNPNQAGNSRSKKLNDGPVTITSLSVSSGIVYSAVTITGSGFSSVTTDNVVKLNGVFAKVNSATATQLIVTVPAGSSTGSVTVTTAGSTATSPASFKVLQIVKDGDFPASSVEIDALSFDRNGGYYVTDNQASVIYKYAGGVLTRLAAISGSGLTNAVVDSQGNVYFGRSDGTISSIYKVTVSGSVAVFAGGTSGYAEGNGLNAKFNHIINLAIDANDNIW